MIRQAPVASPQPRLRARIDARARGHARGDQGFLNSYYAGFASSPLFHPGHVPMPRTSQLPAAPGSTARLSTAYNADVGLYVLNGCVKIKLTAARTRASNSHRIVHFVAWRGSCQQQVAPAA